MSEFTKNSNYKDNAGIKQVKFGFERPILEVELNEMQQVLDSRMREYIKQTSGNCVLGEGTMTYTGGTFKIQNEVAIIDGILVKITSLSLAVSNGEKIYLKIKEKEVAFGDTLKKEGNEQETVNIANYIMDERYNIESTRRIIVSYNLSKTTGETESKYLELGEIVGGQFKVNDNIGSKLDNLIGTLANLTTEERVSLVRAINEIDGNAKAHKAEIMPHQIKNLKTGKTYRYGYQVSDGIPQVISEEVV